MQDLFLLLLIAFSGMGYAQTDSPVGRWKTIDEDTGEAKSIVEIYQEGDAYAGKIAEILTDKRDALCTECEGKDKNKPILGLVIIEDLEADDDPSVWDGGTIVDPQRGSSYKLSVWYEDDNPDILYVRGKHWTGFYRTQQWVRE